jgi:hypothetical protein
MEHYVPTGGREASGGVYRRVQLRIAGALAVALVASSLLGTAAEASQPEVPSLAVAGVTSSGATLLGTLNPGAVEHRESGTYQFVYRPTSTGECKGSEEAVAPITPGFSGGIEHEELFPEAIGGLSAGTKYAVCLVATEAGKSEPAVSAPATFKTRVPPETPETEAATNLTATSAQLNAVLNPGAAAEPGERYNFFINEEAEQCQGPNQHQVPVTAPFAAGAQGEKVFASATELLPRTSYAYCVMVESEDGEKAIGQPITFETPLGAPTVGALVVGGLHSTGATVSGTLFTGGAPTTVEVDLNGAAVAVEQLPASKVAVGIRKVVESLTPATHYVVRISASNVAGHAESEVSFDTPTSSGKTGEAGASCANKGAAGFVATLPDCRAVELVSSATEVGEVYDPGGSDGHEEDITTPRPFRASADGAKVAYIGDPGTTGGDGSTAKGHGNEYLASRGAAGWTSVNITPPVAAGESASAEREYTSFSPDLSTGELVSETPLLAAVPSPQGPEGCNVLYRVDEGSKPPRYEALFTTTLTPRFCGEKKIRPGRDLRLQFAGETPDHTWAVFDTSAELQAPASESFGFGSNVYESQAPTGALAVINVLPNGETESRAVAGAPSEQPLNGPDLANIVTPDGKRVIWSSVSQEETVGSENSAFPTALYAREDPFSSSARTVQLDAAQEGAAGASGGGQFWAASANGDKVFFTDCQRLTSDSTAVTEGNCFHVAGPSPHYDLVKTGSDLYEYNFAKKEVVDLTKDHNASDPLGANVQGVLGTSEDGSYVYIVAGGALSTGTNARGEAPAAERCEQASQGSNGEKEERSGKVPPGMGCNIFLLHFNGTAWEQPRFIAKLVASDNTANAESLNAPLSGGGEITGDWNPRLGSRTAEVTPDGRTLVFSSIHDLTGYNTASVGRLDFGEGGNEIFVYRAGPDTVECASCNPRNVPPDPAIQTGGGEHVGFYTYVPVSSSDTYMHRWVNSNGTEVFFNTSQSLAANDGNRSQDVYEWEAQGSPGCPVATSQFGGCVSLLTAGESEAYSFLVDVSESGDNVFVSHRGALYGVGGSGSKNRLYDLHAGGGGSPRIGEGCTGPATCPAAPGPAAAFSPPASSLVSGNGNSLPSVTKRAVGAKKCKKGFTKKRGKCARARAKKKAKPKTANREGRRK